MVGAEFPGLVTRLRLADGQKSGSVTVQDTDTWDFSSSGVLLAQILKNLTLMATTSQFPKLLVYSAVSSKSLTPGIGYFSDSVPGRQRSKQPFSLTA